MANAGAVIARIITQYSDKGSKAAQKDARKLEQSFDRMSRRTKLAFAGAAAGVGYFAQRIAREGIRAAADEDKALASLGRTLENVGQAFAIPQVNAFIEQQQMAVAVSEDQLRPAFQRLVTVLGDAGLAQEQLALALYVSAGTGRSLDQVVMALSRAFAGNTTGLSRLGAGLDKTLLKSGDLVAITDELNKKFGGQAEVAAASFAGSLTKIKIAADEAKESIGTAIINALIGEGGKGEDQIKKLTDGIAKFGDMTATAFTFIIPFVKDFFRLISDIFKKLYDMREPLSVVVTLIAGAFVAAKVIAFVKAIEGLVKVYKTLRAAGAAAAIATAFATGGVSVIAGTAGAAAAVAAMSLSIGAMNKLFKKMDEASAKVAKNTKASSKETNTTIKPTKTLQEIMAQMEKDSAKTAKNAKDLTAEQKTQAAVLKFSQSVGIDPTQDLESINLFAAAVRKVGADATDIQKKNALDALKSVGNTAAESANIFAAAIREVTAQATNTFGSAAAESTIYNEIIKAAIKAMVDAGVTDVDVLKTAFGSLNEELLAYIANLTKVKVPNLKDLNIPSTSTPPPSTPIVVTPTLPSTIPTSVSKIKAGQTPSFFPDLSAPDLEFRNLIQKAKDAFSESQRFDTFVKLDSKNYDIPVSDRIFASGATPNFFPTDRFANSSQPQGIMPGVTVNVNAPIYGVQDVQRLIIDSVNQAQKNGTTTVLPNAGR
jgi:hypothetical protein